MAMTKLVTAEDLAMLSEDDRFELIRGVLYPVSPTGKPHGQVVGNIHAPLHAYNRQHAFGTVYVADVGVVLERDPDTVLGTDIAFVRGEPVPLADEDEGFILIIPDQVIEVASPSQRRRELREKVARYIEAGVRLVWLAEPRIRTVTVIADGNETVLTEADVLDGGDVLPGFRLPVAEVFR